MKVYRDAAKRIASKKNDFACDAITNSKYFFDGMMHVDKFKDLFYHPESKLFAENDIGFDDLWFGLPNKKENQLARSLALLLMEEIEK